MDATTLHTISRGDGEQVPLGGLDIIFKITSEQTGGALAICETVVEPGRLIPVHVHDTEDEFSYVIDGRIGVLIGGRSSPPRASRTSSARSARSSTPMGRPTSSASPARPRDTSITSAPISTNRLCPSTTSASSVPESRQ